MQPQSHSRVLLIQIKPRKDFDTRCRGYASIMLRECGIVINGIRINERDDGSLHIHMPNIRDHTGQFFPVVKIPDDELMDEIRDVVLDAAYRM